MQPIDQRADLYSREHTFPWSYTYASAGYFYAARQFTLTDEIQRTILDTWNVPRWSARTPCTGYVRLLTV